VNADFWFAAIVATNNANDIEAAGRRLVSTQSAQILAGNGADMFPLVRVYGGRRRRELGAGPGFDFNEAEDSVVPADKINLTPIVRNAKISCHNRVAQSSQVKISFDLALFAGKQVFWPRGGKLPLASSRLRTTNLVSRIITCCLIRSRISN
jgi:hypothetical protein